MVAHELAHEQHVVDRRTSWLFAARASLAESLDGGVHVPAALAGKMFRATQSRSWELETAADASSAEVAGGDAVRGALHQSGKITAAFDLLGEKWSSMLAEDDSYPQDLYDALDVALDDPWVVRLAASAAAAADAEDTMDPVAVSTHPPVATRVAAVPAHSGGSWDADRPVPIRTREALDKWCVQELVGPDDPADGMRPVRVLDCAPERFDEPVEEAYQAMVDATGSESVSGAMSAAVDAIAAGKWVKLAQAIDPEIRRAPPALLEAVCREVVVDCLGRAISQRLLDAGWHRASRWTTSVLFSPEGEDFNVAELIELAVDGADPGSFQALGSLRQLVSLADSRAIL
jgi:hypothetical protein